MLEMRSESKKQKRKAIAKEESLEVTVSAFACPFYKYDPAAYGGMKGCESWASESIDTVIRVSFLECPAKFLGSPVTHVSTIVLTSIERPTTTSVILINPLSTEHYGK